MKIEFVFSYDKTMCVGNENKGLLFHMGSLVMQWPPKPSRVLILTTLAQNAYNLTQAALYSMRLEPLDRELNALQAHI